MKEPIISVSGLRGVMGESLSPELAARFAVAYAMDLPPGPIVLSRDGRATGPLLADAVRSWLTAIGRVVIDCQVCATPTVGVLVRRNHAAGGIQITASHNPPPYNGIKLFSPQGQVLAAAAGEKVVARYRQGETPPWVAFDKIGGTTPCVDTLSQHAELVTATVNVERLQGKHYRVLLDSNHGSGGQLGKYLLQQLGCRVTLLGEEPSGQFAHPPEPTEENLADVGKAVIAAGADIGFCQDPDADRLAVIDAAGRYLGEELTLALCTDRVLSQTAGPVVTNCATSRVTQVLAEKHGGTFYRSAVGEANVAAKMREVEAVFGGEGNGGPIDPRVGYIRDSFVGMALILDLMAEREQTIAQLADALPRYEICKTKIPLEAQQVTKAVELLRKQFPEAEADEQDGLRLDWPDRWLLVRASNTEPIVRAIAEAPTKEQSQQLCDQARQVLETLG